MNRATLLLGASLVVAALLLLSLRMSTIEQPTLANRKATPENAARPLHVSCAASNRAVMEAVVNDYQREFHIPIELQFGPSQTLLSSIEISRIGDLYLPADASYLEAARARGIVETVLPLARMQVVLAVPRGNPKQIHAFDQLLDSDIRVVQANPEVAAVGKLTRDALGEQGKWEDLKEHTAAFVSTVTEVANSVKVGAADVGIVYDAVLTTYPDLEIVRLDEFRDLDARIEIGLVKWSRQPRAALHFARYLAAKDRGMKRYVEFGFTPLSDQPWREAASP